MPLLDAKDIERSFRIGPLVVYALERVSVSINVGDFLVITGPSGSGKSTLLNLLSGLDKPTSGTVSYRGNFINHMTEQHLAELRNTSFGFMFQTPHLLQDKTVLENTVLPFYYGPDCKLEDARNKCKKLLVFLGMGELLERYPQTLSGGEMQRVVFARALSRDPDLIFADEPTGSLDADSSGRILVLLREQARSGRTVVMVSHDPEAIKYGTRFLSLKKISTTGEAGKAK